MQQIYDIFRTKKNQDGCRNGGGGAAGVEDHLQPLRRRRGPVHHWGGQGAQGIEKGGGVPSHMSESHKMNIFSEILDTLYVYALSTHKKVMWKKSI